MFIFLTGKKTNQKKPGRGKMRVLFPRHPHLRKFAGGFRAPCPSLIGWKPVTLPHSTAALPRFAHARLAAVAAGVRGSLERLSPRTIPHPARTKKPSPFVECATKASLV